MDAKQIQAVEGFQGGLRHPDRAGVAFRQTVVAFVAPLPDAVVGGAVGPRHVIHEVLDEISLIPALDHGAAAACELGQLEQEQGACIQLQMPPGVISHHRVPAAAVVLRMQRIEWIKAALETLHFVRLPQHGPQQSTHQGDHPLLQFPGALVVVPRAVSVGHGQRPDALNRVDAVAHPGIAVVAVDGVGGAGGQQAADRILALQNHRLNRTVQAFENGVDVLLVLLRLRCRHHHDPPCRRP